MGRLERQAGTHLVRESGVGEQEVERWMQSVVG